MNNQTNQGFTLLEAMITIAIIGIIAALAVPSYQDMLERNRLKEAAESLANDIKFARTEAIKQSANVTLTVNADNNCYGIATGTDACDCTDGTSCTLRIVDTNTFQGVNIAGTFAGNIVTFEFRRGTVTAPSLPNLNDLASTTLSTTRYSAQINVNNVGRVTVCSSGANPLIPYPDC